MHVKHSRLSILVCITSNETSLFLKGRTRTTKSSHKTPTTILYNMQYSAIVAGKRKYRINTQQGTKCSRDCVQASYLGVPGSIPDTISGEAQNQELPLSIAKCGPQKQNNNDNKTCTQPCTHLLVYRLNSPFPMHSNLMSLICKRT